MSWDLYLQTRSALVLGNVGFVQVAPFLLFALFAGHVADRYDRRRTMILTQLLLLAASVPLLLGFRSVPVIYSCLFLLAFGRAFQWPARQALLPHIVSPEALSNAITWNSSVQEISSVSGPALAGILLATAGSRTVYMVQFCLRLSRRWLVSSPSAIAASRSRMLRRPPANRCSKACTSSGTTN